MKLKTLKDIPHFESGTEKIKELKEEKMKKIFKTFIICWNGSAIEYHKKIKQLAIKWVKVDKFHAFDCENGIKIMMTKNAKDFFELFFNITEEDLTAKQEDFLLEQARELDLKELKGGKSE